MYVRKHLTSRPYHAIDFATGQVHWAEGPPRSSRDSTRATRLWRSQLSMTSPRTFGNSLDQPFIAGSPDGAVGPPPQLPIDAALSAKANACCWYELAVEM